MGEGPGEGNEMAAFDIICSAQNVGEMRSFHRPHHRPHPSGRGEFRRPPTISPSAACGAVLLMVLMSGCIARQMRIAERGLTCVEAQKVAIEAVRRMGYTISEATKAAPGSPGMIVAAREVGTNKQGL